MNRAARLVQLIYGLTIGFQFHVVTLLLPILASELDSLGSLTLLLAAVFLLLLFSQFHLAARVSRIGVGGALRDSITFLSIVFLVFVMAPLALWLFISFTLWSLLVTGAVIAVGRLVLLSGGLLDRNRSLIILLSGFCGGIVLSQWVGVGSESRDFLVAVSIIISGFACYLLYRFAHVYSGYATTGALWLLSDITRDRPLHALILHSAGIGLLLALPVSQKSSMGLAIIGIAAEIITSRKILERWSAEIAARRSAALAAILLIFDATFRDDLFFSAFAIGFHAAFGWSAVHLDAWRPETVMSSTDRLAFHTTGILLGTVFGIALVFFGPSRTELLVATAVFLGAIGYLLSFVRTPPARL